jgi:thiamine pyrophosphate-dependent acetolactate synthase large subunit-like protein
MIDRIAATRALAERLDDQLVVTGLGNVAQDLYSLGDRPLSFYLWGAMGTAASVALGLALAQPRRRVVLLEGDGSLLMGLSALSTIGKLQPSNLTCLVWDNGCYQITGGQPTHTQEGGTDLAGVARACGIERSSVVAELSALEAALDNALAAPGPSLVVARVDAKVTNAYLPRRADLFKYRFMHALGTYPDVGAMAWAQGGPATHSVS